MGSVIRKLMRALGWIRLAEALTEHATPGPAGADEIHRLRPVVDTPRDDKPPVIATDSEGNPLIPPGPHEYAFLHPFDVRGNPDPSLYEEHKLGDGHSLVVALLVVPNEAGDGMSWYSIVSAFRPADQKEQRQMVPLRRGLRGAAILRAATLLARVGGGNVHESWENNDRQVIRKRPLSAAEWQEFKRLHGELWLPRTLGGRKA